MHCHESCSGFRKLLQELQNLLFLRHASNGNATHDIVSSVITTDRNCELARLMHCWARAVSNALARANPLFDATEVVCHVLKFLEEKPPILLLEHTNNSGEHVQVEESQLSLNPMRISVSAVDVEAGLLALAISNQCDSILVACQNDAVDMNYPLAWFNGHDAVVTSLWLDGAAERHASGAADGTIRMWHLNGQMLLMCETIIWPQYTFVFWGHQPGECVTALSAYPGGHSGVKWLASGGTCSFVCLWRSDGHCVQCLDTRQKKESCRVTSVAWSTDGSLLHCAVEAADGLASVIVFNFQRAQYDGTPAKQVLHLTCPSLTGGIDLFPLNARALIGCCASGKLLIWSWESVEIASGEGPASHNSGTEISAQVAFHLPGADRSFTTEQYDSTCRVSASCEDDCALTVFWHGSACERRSVHWVRIRKAMQPISGSEIVVLWTALPTGVTLQAIVPRRV